MEDLWRQTVRLRLLALVLALALTWFAMNPTFGPVRLVRRDEETPDEERRMSKSPAEANCDLGRTGADATVSALRSPPSEAEVNLDDLEWPEIIDVS